MISLGLFLSTAVHGSRLENQNALPIYKFRNEQGVLSFSDRKPASTIQFETLRFDCFACKTNKQVNWEKTPLNLVSYRKITQSISDLTSIDESLIRAVIHAESAFNPHALSSQGALGLMQLMPQTAKELGVSERRHPEQNIFAGSHYLAQQLKRYQGNVALALASYNAGPGAVDRFKGVPPYEETKRYIKRVQILQRRYQKALD